MSTTSIKLKKSSVAGRVPTPSDLNYGELAINYADGKIYYKNSSNEIKAFIDSATVASIAATGGGGSVDAATLEGQAGSFYLNYNNFTNTPNLLDSADVSSIIIADVDKAFVDTLSINADQVDGLEASQFVRSDTSDTMTGNLTINGTITTDSATVDNLATNYVDYATGLQSENVAQAEGRVYYNDEYKALTVYNDITGSSLQLGHEEWVRVYNNSGSTITNGTPVYVTGATGETVNIAPADATTEAKAQVLGIATHDITNGSSGVVAIRGLISGIDTSSLTAGNRVHLSASGGYAEVAPTYPYFPVDLGTCVVSDSAGGSGYIYVDLKEHHVESFRVTGNSHLDGNLTVDGDLTINGTQSVVSQANLSIDNSFVYLNSGNTIGDANTTFSGTGLDDGYFTGHYEGTTTKTYYVRIDGVGAGAGGVDTFEWSYDSDFSVTQATDVDISGSNTLADNISIFFNATTGHTLNDTWFGTASPVNVDTGWFTNRNTGTSGIGYTHLGIFYDVSDDKFKVVDEYAPEPEGTIDTNDSSFSLGTMAATSFEGNLTGNVTGNVTGNITGAVTATQANFADNAKAIFGTGSDLQIYHNGNDSYIEDAGAGALKLKGEIIQAGLGNQGYFDFLRSSYTPGSAGLRIGVGSANQHEIKTLSNVDLVLERNDDEKLRLTSTGVDITGTLTSDGLTVDTNTLHVDNTNNRVGIGTTSPDEKLHIVNNASGGNDNFMLMLQNTTTVADSRSGIMFSTNSGQGSGRDGAAIQASNNGIDGKAHITFGNVINNTYEEKVRFTTDGNVGVGTSSPSSKLHLQSGTTTDFITLEHTSGPKSYIQNSSVGSLIVSADETNTGASSRIEFKVDNAERMRIGSTGTVTVGKTAEDIGTAGHAFAAQGYAFHTRSGNTPLFINRLTNDGNLVEFRKDGTGVGSIGTVNGDILIRTGNTGIRFVDGSEDIRPVSSTGNNLDATLDLGVSGARFKDLYLSGNINVGGTVDGRDVAADGTKLDGIESGATGDQTASEILTAIKTVDGAGSGLDADLLDGQSSAYYLDWTNTTNKPDPTLTLTGDVTGSATFTNLGNATLSVTVADDSHNHTTANIDGLAEFVSDTVGAMVTANTESGISVTYDDTDNTLDFNVSDPTITLTGAVTGSGTMTNLGNVSIATTATADPTLTINGDASGSATFTNLGNATLTLTVADDSHNHVISNVDGLQTALDAKLASSSYTAADVLTKIKTVDGSGSGLDADLLDGLNSAQFLRSDADDTTTGALTINTTGRALLITGNSTLDNADASIYLGNAPASYGFDITYEGTGNGNTNAFVITSTNAGTPKELIRANQDGIVKLVQSGATIAGNTIWHAGNDGSGSGLDADLLDGQQGSYYTGYTDTAIANLVASAPGTLDTLNELAAALGDDANFSTTVTNSIATKADKTITISAGSGLTGGGDLSANRTISHSDTSTQASVNNSNGTVIQDVTLDGFGHVTGLASVNLDSRYYTESEADSRFVNVTGDTMSGALTVSSTITATGNIYSRNGDNSDIVIGEHPSYTAYGAVWLDGESDYRFLADPSGGHTYINALGSGHIFFRNDNSTLVEIQDTGALLINGNTAFHDGYHPNADKWTTARTLSLTGAVTGSVSIDGSGNVSLATTATSDPTLTLTGDATGSATFTNLGNATLTVTVANDSHTHDGRYYTETEADSRFVNVTGDTMSGQLVIDDGEANPLELKRSSQVGIEFNDTSVGSRYLGVNGGNLWFGSNLNHGINNKVFHDGYHPNADKWTTARTLSLSGDASGSVSWDGSANATLSVTVADDSHSHSNYLPKAGGTMTGTLNMGANNITMSNSNITGVNQITINDPGEGIVFSGSTNITLAAIDDANDNIMNFSNAAELRRNNNKVWDAGNDGSGSGLDADLLDGVQGSSYLRSDADDTFSGNLTLSKDGQDVLNFSANDTNDARGISFNNRTALSADYNDGWLRLNQLSEFSNGVYTPGLFRVDGALEVASIIRHEGDNNTNISFGTDTITIATGGSSEITVDTTGVRLGDTGNGYFQPVSGEYGSIQIDGGAHGSWEGYSIGGRIVFMHDNSSGAGIFNDVDNEWMFYGTRNAETRMYYNGSEKIRTTSTGVDVTGSLTATTKSFVIDHPTKEGMKLRHGSLEGPEDGVYVRGRLKDNNVIELPDYWTGLVHEDSITVNLTAIGRGQDLWVEDIVDNTVVVGGENINCFYTVYATRKDVEAFEVEYEA